MTERIASRYGNYRMEIWERGTCGKYKSIAVIPSHEEELILKVLDGAEIPEQYRGQSFEVWMQNVNNLSRGYGITINYTDETWDAFITGVSPRVFWAKVKPY